MTYSSKGGSTTSTTTFSPGSEQNSYNSFDSALWNRCGQKADAQLNTEDLKQLQKTFFDTIKQQSGSDSLSSEPTWTQQDPHALHRGLEAIASSLSLLTNTLGLALEEQRQCVESKASELMHKEPHDLQQKKIYENTAPERCQDSPLKPQVGVEKGSPMAKSIHMKAPRELAMAMTTKAKLLLRELKGVKQDLIFTNDRCAQLEEENKRLRESIEKGVRHEEDDLVRLQLEALLTEKARLAQENATYARENQFLHEVVQYQQLKLRELAVTDESLMTFEDELSFDAAMDLLPLYRDENESNNNDMEEPLQLDRMLEGQV